MKIDKKNLLTLSVLTALSSAFTISNVNAKTNRETSIISMPGLMPSASLEMSDEPGLWFKDPVDGDALVVIKPDQAVLIKTAESNTDHTITSLLWPAGAKDFPVDQEKPSNVSVTTAFDKPGLYVFTCKVHPYMFGAVIVDDPETEGLDIGAELELVTGAKVPSTSDIAKKLLRTFFVVTTPSLWRDYSKPTWDVKLPALPINLGGTVVSLDVLNVSMPNQLFNPATEGIGEIWVNTQFEGVQGKTKPGTATQIDASNWKLKQKVKGIDIDMNHPHNMWPDKTYSYIYQTEWFDKRLTTFDRTSGKVLSTVNVGESPSHVMTSPIDDNLYVAINAAEQVVRLSPGPKPSAISSFNMGPHTSPHGHYVTEDGKHVLTPNALASSVSIAEIGSGKVTEIPTGGVIPIAIWGNPQGTTAYAANFLGTPPSMLASLSVIDVKGKKKLSDINIAKDYDPVSGKITGEAYGLLPIQTPVSPDGKYVVTANTLSMSITIVDTATNEVVKSLPCEPGCHGVEFGLKKGGGYYAYVASKFANDLIVVDMDKLEVAGRILLSDPNDAQITAHNGMGGQGVLPLPLAEHVRLNTTRQLVGTGKLSSEVEGWFKGIAKTHL